MEFSFKNLNMRRGITASIGLAFLLGGSSMLALSLGIVNLQDPTWFIVAFATSALVLSLIIMQYLFDDETVTLSSDGMQSHLFGEIPFSEIKTYYFDHLNSTKLIIKTRSKKISYAVGTVNATESEFNRFIACFEEKIGEYIKNAEAAAASGTAGAGASIPKNESVYAKTWFLCLMIFASLLAGLLLFVNPVKAIFAFGFLVPMWYLTLRARIAESA